MKKENLFFNYLFVGLGAFVGANLRYAIGQGVSMTDLSNYPFHFGTLFANVIGALIAGILAGFFVFLAHNKVKTLRHMRLFWLTGLCGGLTTFSTFSHETLELLMDNHLGMIGLGLLNVIANVSLSLLFFFISYKMFRIITKYKEGASE